MNNYILNKSTSVQGLKRTETHHAMSIFNIGDDAFQLIVASLNPKEIFRLLLTQKTAFIAMLSQKQLSNVLRIQFVIYEHHLSVLSIHYTIGRQQRYYVWHKTLVDLNYEYVLRTQIMEVVKTHCEPDGTVAKANMTNIAKALSELKAPAGTILFGMSNILANAKQAHDNALAKIENASIDNRKMLRNYTWDCLNKQKTISDRVNLKRMDLKRHNIEPPPLHYNLSKCDSYYTRQETCRCCMCDPCATLFSVT
jgi:hypothetical protein